MTSAIIIKTGVQFGRLRIIERLGTSKNGHAIWLCECSCGNTTAVFATNLRRNHTQSCGCLNTEAITKHGLRNSPTYITWRCMLRRCFDKQHKHYHRYGGRGITVCKEWTDFKAFVKDMGLRPAGKTIDRKDNNGNYEKGNCRWATAEEQHLNKTQRQKTH